MIYDANYFTAQTLAGAANLQLQSRTWDNGIRELMSGLRNAYVSPKDAKLEAARQMVRDAAKRHPEWTVKRLKEPME